MSAIIVGLAIVALVLAMVLVLGQGGDEDEDVVAEDEDVVAEDEDVVAEDEDVVAEENPCDADPERTLGPQTLGSARGGSSFLVNQASSHSLGPPSMECAKDMKKGGDYTYWISSGYLEDRKCGGLVDTNNHGANGGAQTIIGGYNSSPISQGECPVLCRCPNGMEVTPHADWSNREKMGLLRCQNTS